MGRLRRIRRPLLFRAVARRHIVVLRRIPGEGVAAVIAEQRAVCIHPTAVCAAPIFGFLTDIRRFRRIHFWRLPGLAGSVLIRKNAVAGLLVAGAMIGRAAFRTHDNIVVFTEGDAAYRTFDPGIIHIDPPFHTVKTARNGRCRFDSQIIFPLYMVFQKTARSESGSFNPVYNFAGSPPEFYRNKGFSLHSAENLL